jgi:tetratricopeptide (TPR) repeat protein
LITDAPGSQPDLDANIIVEFAPQAVLQRIDPTAACFVAPNVASLAEYRMRRGSDALDWQTLRQRQKLTVFIPSDTSPQEQRDCLHEEVAQALGPLNDLFRLPDSIFNDDNFLSTLTGFDMLVLRVHYDPELAAGMTRDQVAARLPAILARLNPAGAGPGLWDHPDTPRDWTQAVRTAFGADTLPSARLPAARKMLAIAEAEGWQDARLGLSHFALGRLQDRDQARLSFQAAAKVFAPLPDGGVRLAQTLLQLAVLDLAAGRTDSAIDLTQTALPLAKTAQNAVLITNLSLLQAEALDRMGQTAAATALRLDTLPAARYGFGSAQSGPNIGP